MIDVITCVLAVIFFIFLGYRPPWYTKKFQDFQAKEVQNIPGPLSLPILGTRWLFSMKRYKMNKIHEYYIEMRKKYGKILKEETLFNIPVISVFDKKDIEKVLRNTAKYPIRPPTEAIAKYRSEHPEKYASIGLTNEQGEKWHFLRTSLTAVLTSPKTIHDFLPQMEEIADDWCYLLSKKRNKNGYIYNLEELARRLGLEATCALVLVGGLVSSALRVVMGTSTKPLLGRRMGFLIEDQKHEVAEKLAKSVHQNFIACRDTYYGLPLWKLFSTTSYKNLCQSESDMYEYASELIRTADESTKDSAVFQSVLNAHIDEREKKSAIVDFLAAGIHTLKNSLLFLLYQIAMNPECQQKIIEDPTKSYLKACSMETFRLSPTVNCLARIIDTDMELAGYHINAGSVILCHTASECKNEKNFKEAKKFKPERWINGDKNETAASAAFLVTPFGYGKRICPGKRFVEQVLPIILDKMVEKFVISVEKPMELEFEFLLAPKGNVCMNFVDRI